MLTTALIIAYGACLGVLLAHVDGRDVPAAVTVASRGLYLISVVALAWGELVDLSLVFVMILVSGVVVFVYGPTVWADHPALAGRRYWWRVWAAQRYRKHLRATDAPLPGRVSPARSV